MNPALKEQIITQRDERFSKVPAETPLNQEQCHELEADVIGASAGKDKIVKSSWVAGYGSVLRKKDCVALTLA